MFVFWIPLGTFGSLIYVLMAIHTFRVIAISKKSPYHVSHSVQFSDYHLLIVILGIIYYLVIRGILYTLLSDTIILLVLQSP